MKRFAEQLKKLRGRSAKELSVRSRQALSVIAEKRGLSRLSRLPSDEYFFSLLEPDIVGAAKDRPAALLDHLRTRTSPNFFSSFKNPGKTVATGKQFFGTRWSEELTESADRIVAGRFALLGLTDLDFGSPVKWRYEPTTDVETPLQHWSEIEYLNANVAGDKKVTWELNRHQYFVTLGQAYWLTGDERYAEVFVDHIRSWLEQNPPKLGINWSSSLEIAFRSISWLWAFQFFKHSAAFKPELYIECLKVLYLNALHLATYPSTYFSPNTHLTGEALGLFYLGTMLPEFKESRRWRDLGANILLEQLPRHVKDDGVYFEQSTYYHRYTTDFYTHFLILARRNHLLAAEVVPQKLKKLLDHLMYITRPDGTTPFLGDDDGGRLMFLDSRAANDFRAALSTGASLFSRADYKFVSAEPAEETLWLLGPDGLKDHAALPAAEPQQQSIAFPDGGYYVMRDSWRKSANYLLFDTGPHGSGNSVHAHADSLSIELASHGHTLLVDPGTYTYTRASELRDWFRSSAAHNTLTVDGVSSSIPAGPFSWKEISHAEKRTWISHTRFDFAEGVQNGYARLAKPGFLHRSLLFLKQNYWIMQDCLTATDLHHYDLWFHFSPDSIPELRGPELRENSREGGLIVLSFGQNASWRREEGWVSYCYGERTPAPVYAFTSDSTNGADFVTFLLPNVRGELRPHINETEAAGGRVFEVISDDWRDIVMMKRQSHVKNRRFASDFEWIWSRFSSSDMLLPQELVLINGSHLELDGRPIVCSERRINYLVARRVGEQFRVETDQGILDLSLPIDDLESLFGEHSSTDKLS